MFCIGLLAIICGAHSASAQTHTWIGTSGDWFEGTNWDAGVPTAGATVVVSAGAVSLTNTTEALSSFTLNGGTLTFSNWTTRLISTNIAINTGMVTHVTNLVSTTNNLGQWIPVARVNLECGTLFVKTGAAINVNSKGYPGGTNGGISRGQGPGGGYAGGRGGGGGHGGRGGPGIYTSVDVLFAGGDTNGVASTPVNPGSGGACGSSAGERGGYGGGAIVITASGAVTNNGIISANGGPYLGASTRSGGGSGGAVYLTCDTVAGLGSFQASGGNGSVAAMDNGGGGGGGGRIAILYNPAAQSNQPLPQLAFLAGGGVEPASSGNVPMAEVGTLYFSDSRFIDTVGIMGPANFKGQLILGEALAWSTPNLVVSNTVIRFPGSGFELSVLTNLTIDGSGRLEIGNTSYRLSDSRMVLFNDQPLPSRLNVGGTFHVKKGTLFVYACPTNAGVPDYGALVSVTGDMIISTGSVVRPISHPENGGSALLRAGNVRVELGGVINADYTGFFCDQGPGKGTKNIRAGGGGYGGSGGGGEYVYSFGGKPYGSAQEPRQAGSGGGTYDSTRWGGRGGGVIRLEASGQVLCNGTLTANGEYGLNSAGGGAGGSILLVCNTFASTNGLIRANGLYCLNTDAGGGGGGRIALRYNPASQAAVPRPVVTITATGGTGQETADIGTIYLPDTKLLTNEITRFSGQLTGFNNWTTDSLLVSNCFIRFPDDGFALTVSNRLTIAGSAARLDIGANASLPMTTTNVHYQLYNSGAVRPILTVGGDLVLTNRASLHVFSMSTNEAVTDNGAGLTVVGKVELAPQTWINLYSNPTNGGSALCRFGNLIVATNAGFRADRTGFFSMRGPGKGAVAGGRGGGAGYGGKGGRGSDAGSLGGQPYGSSNAPVDCGSGGGTVNNGTTSAADYGGRGGGLVRIEAAGQVKLDGTLSCAGETMPTGAQASGAGSGGGIFLQCRRLTGVGAFTANGGAGRATIGGGGGGGRIAVYATGGGAFTGTFSANGGTGYESGALGSIVYESRSSGTVMLIR
jgi:hypothetical protein